MAIGAKPADARQLVESTMTTMKKAVSATSVTRPETIE